MTQIASKMSTVLDFMTAEGGEATFVVKDMENGGTHLRRIEIPRPMWAELGLPTRITVTIEPGDLLNEGESNDS